MRSRNCLPEITPILCGIRDAIFFIVFVLCVIRSEFHVVISVAISA